MIITVFRYVLLYIIIIMGSLFVKKITDRKIESSISIYILASIIILYLFGLFNALIVGVYVVSIISIILGIYAIFKTPKDDFKDLKIAPGLIFFTFLFTLFMLTTYTKVSNGWDEFSLWSLSIKKMFYTNKLQYFFEYPPVPCIWNYFVCKIIGTYSQGIEFLGLYIFSYSLLLPLFNIKENQSKLYNLFLSIVCICLPIIFSEMFFVSALYADVVIGVLLGFIFVEKFINKKDKFSNCIIVMAFICLCLTKATGFYISLIVIFSYFGIKILENLKECKKDGIKYLKNFTIIVIITIITLASWKIFIKINQKYEIKRINIVQSDALDSNALSVKDLIKSAITVCIQHNVDLITSEIAHDNFVEYLVKYKITNGFLKLSIVSATLLYFLVLILIYKRNKDKNIKNIIIFSALSFALYLLFLQVAYFTKFNVSEAMSHNSLARYTSSYLLGLYILLVAVLTNSIKKDYKINMAIIMIGVLIITPLKDVADITITAGFYNFEKEAEVRKIKKETIFLKEKVENNSKVYVINQNLEDNKFQYYMLPENDVEIAPYFGNNHAENEKEQFKELIKSYDYIYVRKADEYLNKNYEDVFGNKIEDKEVYKVIKDNEKYRLEKIN